MPFVKHEISSEVNSPEISRNINNTDIKFIIAKYIF
jgi:hypothetical protein